MNRAEARIYLLEQIDGFMARHGMNPTQFGQRCIGDKPFVKRVRCGKVPGEKQVARILSWMEQWDREGFAPVHTPLRRGPRSFPTPDNKPVDFRGERKNEDDIRAASERLLARIIKLYQKTGPSIEAGMAAHLYPGVRA